MIDRELVTRKMVLVSEDLLPSDFAARLAPCAGLRNRIVHAYDDLDPGRVYDALRATLADVPSYLAAIRRFLDTTVS